MMAITKKHICIVLFTLIFTLALEEKAFLIQVQNQYTIQNPQYLREISALKGHDELSTLKNIWQWQHKNFHIQPAEGKYIGKLTIDDILKSRCLTGCHDMALLFVSLLNYFKIPSIMIDTTGIKFSKDFLNNPKTPFEGHVFVEVKIQDKWVLLEPVKAKIIEDYDPQNPIIPINRGDQSDGYYVMCKGIDSWDCGIRSLQNLEDLQRKTAYSLNFSKLKYPNYITKQLNVM